MGSLIRQRQRLVGERNRAIVFVVFGLTSLGFSATSSMFTQVLTALGPAGIGLVFTAIGIVRLRAAHRNLAAFETEHGVGAGKQAPIR